MSVVQIAKQKIGERFNGEAQGMYRQARRASMRERERQRIDQETESEREAAQARLADEFEHKSSARITQESECEREARLANERYSRKLRVKRRLPD